MNFLLLYRDERSCIFQLTLLERSLEKFMSVYKSYFTTHFQKCTLLISQSAFQKMKS